MSEHKQPWAVRAETTVNVGVPHARRWFLELETHPERYQFETHAGFAFSQGNFGEIGARFQTWEQFHGLKINLHFELTATSDYHFQFRLLRPPLPIWGAFFIEKASDNTTNLRLEVGGTTTVGWCLLKFPLIRKAVQRQIQGEVGHIKTSMEAEHKRAIASAIFP
jgi:hypothetical protein